MKGKKENVKKVWLEVIRCVAVGLVIFNHTDGFFLYYANTDNALTYLYSLTLSILCRTAVPLFFMVSGALLLEKQESYHELLKHRICKILAVIILFSGIQYGVDIARNRIHTVSMAGFIRGILSGTIEETYWFLYAYLGILLILPVMRCVVREMKKKDFLYLIALAFVLETVLPILGDMLKTEFPSSLIQGNLYIFYMLIGFYLMHIEWQESDLKKIMLMGICAIGTALAASAAIVMWDSNILGEYRVDRLDIFTLVLAVLIFATIKAAGGMTKDFQRCRNVFLHVGKLTFGIYLTEQLVRTLLLPIYLYLTEKTVGIIACTVYVLGTYAVAGILVEGMRRLPGFKRFL